MAMQAAWLLAEHLSRWRRDGQRTAALPVIATSYAAAWRRHFAPRLRASSLIAHWAMHPRAVESTLPLLWIFPKLLTWGARLSGKAAAIVP